MNKKILFAFVLSILFFSGCGKEVTDIASENNYSSEYIEEESISKEESISEEEFTQETISKEEINKDSVVEESATKESILEETIKTESESIKETKDKVTSETFQLEENTNYISEEKNTSLQQAESENIIVTKENPLIKNVNLEYESYEEIPKEYVNEVVGIIIQAFKELDYETIDKYLANGLISYKERFEGIKNNSDAAELWGNTIGSIVYLKDSRILLTKNLDYVYSTWYTDSWKNNVNLGISKASELNIDQIKAIYNNYYVKAPYFANDDFLYNLGFKIEDGSLVCDPSYIFAGNSFPCMDILFNQDNSINYGCLMFSNDYPFSLGYDYIRGDNDFSLIPDFEVFLNKDIDGIIETTEKLNDENKTGPYWECYEEYFKNEENKAALKKYLDEETEFYRGITEIYCFYNVDLKTTFPNLSEEDFKTIESFNIKIMNQKVINSYPMNFNYNFIFYDIIKESF